MYVCSRSVRPLGRCNNKLGHWLRRVLMYVRKRIRKTCAPIHMVFLLPT